MCFIAAARLEVDTLITGDAVEGVMKGDAAIVLMMVMVVMASNRLSPLFKCYDDRRPHLPLILSPTSSAACLTNTDVAVPLGPLGREAEHLGLLTVYTTCSPTCFFLLNIKLLEFTVMIVFCYL